MNIPPYIIYLKRLIVCMGLLFVLFIRGYAGEQKGKGESEKPLMLYFRFDKATVDGGYMNNAQTLLHIDNLFTDVALCKRIDSIQIYSSASPEGSATYNEHLALRRSTALRNYLVWKYPHIDKERVHACPQGENWSEFRQLILEDKNLPDREEVIQIMEKNPDKEKCKLLLKKLDGGIPYRYIQDHLLCYLRNAAAYVVWMKPEAATETVTVTHVVEGIKVETVTETVKETKDVDGVKVETLTETKTETVIEADTASMWRGQQDFRESRPIEIAASTPKYVHRPLLALKTNVLFDAALIPNVEMEVPIGKRWSVNGEYIFPWWQLDHNKYCMEVIAGSLEGRYWMGSTQSRNRREVLTGHYIGLYAGGGKYDLQWKDQGYQGEFFIAAGISYGWAARIARNLHLELSLGIGLLRTDYRHYHAQNNYQTLMWQENGNYTWLGPTKAKISLVWLLNRKLKKGGAE